MIVTKIYGGLAGQMLQYSLGRHLSIKNRTRLYLDTTWYNDNHNPQHPRDFKLNKLKTNFKIINPYSLAWKLKFGYRYKGINPFVHTTIKEKDFSKFDESIINLGDRVILDGYWFSYKYFEEIRKILVEELVPNELPNDQNSEILKKIRNTNSVSIHFRRGDYALTNFHGILTKNYYEEAIKFIEDKVPNPYLYIFSDEPEWVVNNMNFSLPFKIVDFNNNEMNYWDIELMRNCKHNIIANSGFSWWGAWLNNNEDKIVVAPEKWVNLENNKFENIPNDWVLK